MDSILLVPLLTPSTRYSEWKLKMIASLKRQGLYEVYIGLGKESYEYENDQINDGDRAFGTICLALSPSCLRYLVKSIEYPKDLWTKLDRTFGKHNEDHNSTLKSTPSTTRVLDSKVSASTFSDEIVQDEEEAKSITQSIRMEESLLTVTPSPDAPEVCEISDISSPHMDETEENIQISDIEEKHCCTSMQTFTGDFPLNYSAKFVNNCFRK